MTHNNGNDVQRPNREDDKQSQMGDGGGYLPCVAKKSPSFRPAGSHSGQNACTSMLHLKLCFKKLGYATTCIDT